MFPTIPTQRLEALIATTGGQIQFAIVLFAFLAGWLVDRWVERGRAARGDADRMPGGVVRGIFPISALVLLLLARAAWGRRTDPLFLDIAVPLAIALAGIRVLVYMVRKLFPGAGWLRTSERTIGLGIWGALALHYFGIGAEIVDGLDAVRIPIGRSHVTLLTVLSGALVVLVTLAATLWLAGFVERRLMNTDLNANVRAVMVKFLRAVLVVAGVLIALQAIGIDLTLLSVFGGALGVGVGLGLQKLAANYIAGFTILLDKSVKLGDLVTVDGKYGVVAEVTSRYVVVRGMDGIEAIVPNETLITTTVLNHSHSDRKVRIAIPVQVAYGCDIDRALAALEAAARDEPRALQDAERAPAAFVAGFADSGINLELGVWVGDPENGQLNLRSAINRRILANLAAEGIAIPFPQREVRVLATPAGGPALP